MTIKERLKKISEKIDMTDEDLKAWSDQLGQDAKKLRPVTSKTGLMLPPEEYNRQIDKYLDEVFGKGSFR